MKALRFLIAWFIGFCSGIIRSEAGEFTLVGWQASLDEDATLSNVAACVDQHVSVSGNRIYVPSLSKLLAEYAAQANTVTQVQLQSPSLRRVCLLDVATFQKGIKPSGDESWQPHWLSPIDLEVNEGLEAFMLKPADSAIVATVLAWLGDGALVPVTGEIFTIRVTASITSIVGTWVNGALTFTQTLPVGKYAIVGAKFIEVGGDIIAFRLVIPGYQWRPGGLGSNDYGAGTNYSQRYGGMGIWCEFDSVNPPSLDVLFAAAATQTIVGFLDIIKTG